CIRRRPDLRQQSCGRDRLQQVAGLAREHLRQHSGGSVNVGHDVHFPASLPTLATIAAPWISAATRSAPGTSMSETTTAPAPSAANFRHSASPIPLAPPVTMITLS